ncbi:transcriptional regulator FeaR [Pseudomonas sp. LRF_L74]|uniref:transcriptional regulator FeaR n=1 Tax=Pseudomonas sp. LRF_L74 TaxID=3369422 RepID=UPI003F63DE7C
MNHALHHEYLFQGREGFEVWHGNLASNCGTFHVEPPMDVSINAFQGAVTSVDAERCLVQGARITSNCSHVHRSQRDIQGDDQDFFYLVLQLNGEALSCQSGMQTRLHAGDLVLLDVAQPSDFYFQGLSDQVSVILPRCELLQRLQTQRLRLNQRIDAGTSIGALSAMLVNRLVTDTTLAKVESIAVMDAVLALLKPVLAAHGNDKQETPPPVILVKAKAIIERHLADENLCPEQIASEAGTSVRSLHRLFAQFDMSVGRYILERRLQRCADSIQRSDLKISHIAVSWGFKDLSHFSRAFKQRFDRSPSEYRQR